MKQNDQLKQPFFAQFLESQKTENAQQQGLTAIMIDIGHQTHKYPSDNDEGGDPIWKRSSFSKI